MKASYGILVLLLNLCLFTQSCSEDPIEPSINNLAPFVGTYAIQGTHSQLQEIITLDSMGNFLSSELGLVEEALSDTIELIQFNTDSLNVSTLIRQNTTIDAKLFLANDTLNIYFNQGEGTNVDRITGKIWLQNDQIYLDYRWTKGTNWGEQFPLYGEINANGPKL